MLTMLQQYYKNYIPTTKSSYISLSKEFSALPLYFMKYYGRTKLADVLDVMDYSTYVYDVSHIVKIR